MDTTSSLQLPGARLERIERNVDDITLHFSLVHLVQVMEGAFQDSLWNQACDLVIRNVIIEGELPECPCEIQGGDMTNNISPTAITLPCRSTGKAASAASSRSPAAARCSRPTAPQCK